MNVNQPRIDEIDLTTDERVFIENALSVWGGPANHGGLPFDALGFPGGWPEFDVEVMRLGTAVLDCQSLRDERAWARVLFFAELAFGSEIFGAGTEYSLTRQLPDQTGILALLSIQRKLRPYRDSLGSATFTDQLGSTLLEPDPKTLGIVSVALEPDERRFIAAALGVWDGVARDRPVPTRELRFSDLAEFLAETHRLGSLLVQHRTMSRLECSHVLFFTELAFSSDLFGAGLDFAAATGIPDSDGIVLLRQIQRKLLRDTGGQVFVQHQ